MPETNVLTAAILPVHFCAFCGRDAKRVEIIVLGPRMVGICDRCVDACLDIIAEYRAEQEGNTPCQDVDHTPGVFNSGEPND